MLPLHTSYYQTAVDIPKQLADLNEINKKDSVLIAGGTLLQLGWEAGASRPAHLISTEKIKELHGIGEISVNQQEFLEIGAATALADCCMHPSIVQYAPVFASACQKIAAPAVRNRATIGGNIAGKVGDSIPALLVLEAKLSIYDGQKETIIPIEEWLTRAIPPNDQHIITKILIPIKEKETEHYFFQKVARRESFTAAIISVAGFLKIVDKQITEARFAIGGGAHSPQRLLEAERLILTNSCDFFSFAKTVESSLATYSDAFVAASYRKKVAANILFANYQKMMKEAE